MISLCWVLGLCKLSAAGTILVFFFLFLPVCGACGNGICAGALQTCSAATLPRPRGRTRRRHTQVRARPLIGLLLIAACLLPLLDRKNQMVMDGMDNRVRSAIMPLCLAFSGREERTWLWPLGLGGSACAGGRWCRRPSPSLLCCPARHGAAACLVFG